MSNQDHSAEKKVGGTTPLNIPLHPGPKMPARALMEPPPAGARLPWRLLMQISGDKHGTVGIDVKDKILIGRSDATTHMMPDLNLTPYGAEKHGVSRIHAQIVQYDQTLYIEDLASTNGTRLNGFMIEPQHGYYLRDGDELELGDLRIVIRFMKTPKLVPA